MDSGWGLCLLLLSIAPCLVRPFATRRSDDVRGRDFYHIDVGRKQRREENAHGGGPFLDQLNSPKLDRHQTLQSALERLISPYKEDTYRRGGEGKSSNMMGDSTRAAPTDALKHLIGDDPASAVHKRYYFRRKCNLNRLTRQTFVELIKTGKICGLRLANLRFGLTGR